MILVFVASSGRQNRQSHFREAWKIVPLQLYTTLQGSSDGDEVADLTLDHIKCDTYKKVRALDEMIVGGHRDGASRVGAQAVSSPLSCSATAAAVAATDGTTTQQQQKQQQHLTQRVRNKAWKLQVPVVSVQWIGDCRARRQCVPFESKHLWQQESPQTTVRSKKRKVERRLFK